MVPLNNLFVFYAFIEVIYLGCAFLRLWVLRKRTRTTASLTADICFYTSVAIGHAQFWMLLYGLIEEKRLSKILPPEQVPLALLAPKYLKIYFAETVLYFPQLWLVKIAFLGFYWGFFQHLSTKLRMALYVATGITLSTLVLNVVLSLAWCRPINLNWSATTQSCSPLRDLRSASISFATNALTDITLVALPCLVLHTLQLRRREWYALASVFALGLMTIAATTIRFSVLYRWIVQPETSSTAVRTIEIWTTVELTAGEVAFCLPAFRAFLRGRSDDGSAQKRSAYGSASRSRSRGGGKALVIGVQSDFHVHSSSSETELCTIQGGQLSTGSRNV